MRKTKFLRKSRKTPIFKYLLELFSVQETRLGGIEISQSTFLCFQIYFLVHFYLFLSFSHFIFHYPSLSPFLLILLSMLRYCCVTLWCSSSGPMTYPQVLKYIHLAFELTAEHCVIPFRKTLSFVTELNM